ncbi:MAG TPA: DUF4381 domain-containing protein [Dokdonella sp.]|jgi:hypothetical protein|uniref:DUF4381 domain-containing protein n=1 Tax=Dokdonella sp. TaxID=2291710 RepID=UPI001B78C022|nr:DUF4381 domain-containing protein [Dokdonella sp.]MBP6328943.1 DUF4381 domain-containing protein [Dokdonella sp.]HNV07406.1 DUF4381 domain-containing protein [Dokdonella sp.]HPW03557.1 DUF4381 domain-containing protein [Dokdonella sp.]
MNADGPQLRDIHLPPDPSWWPPAPGWWALALIGVVLVLWAGRWFLRSVRRRRWHRRVLAEFDQAVAAHAAADNGAELAARVSAVLRRAGRLLDTRSAALQGEAWLRFLDDRMRGSEFCSGVGRVLLDAPYRSRADIDAPALIALSRRWLQHALGEVDVHA